MKLINGEQFHHGISCLAESFRHWHPCATQLCPCKWIARLWDARPTEDDLCSPLTSSIFVGGRKWSASCNTWWQNAMNPRHPRHHKDTESRSLHLHQTLQVIFWSNLRCFLLFLGGDRGLGLTKMDEKNIRILIPGLFVVLFLGQPKRMRKNEENIWSLPFFTALLFFRDGYKLASKYCMRQRFLGTFFVWCFVHAQWHLPPAFCKAILVVPDVHTLVHLFFLSQTLGSTRFKDLAISSVSSQVRIFSGQSNCGTICLQTLFAVYWHFTVLANFDSPTQI